MISCEARGLNTPHREWSMVGQSHSPASIRAIPRSYRICPKSSSGQFIVYYCQWNVPERTPPELLLHVRRRGVHPLAMHPKFKGGPETRPDHRPRAPRSVRSEQKQGHELKNKSTDVHRDTLPPHRTIGGAEEPERRTAYTWRSWSFAGANDSLRAFSTARNHCHPTEWGWPQSGRSTRGSCVNREPTAHTSNTVAPKPPSRRCCPPLTPFLNVGSCRSGKWLFMWWK